MSDDESQRSLAFLAVVQQAIEGGSPAGRLTASAVFNTVADHVMVLLNDAVEAFRRPSLGTAVFLAVTAMEETAKAEILAFRVIPRPEGRQPKGRDPLRDHHKKHLIAVRDTTFMGRLPALLGNAICERLRQEAEAGRFVELREAALYTNFDKDGIYAPATITRERAREILLLALECADDILVGWTEHSFSLRERLEAWLAEISHAPS